MPPDRCAKSPVQVCGSPGEVGSKPELGHRFGINMINSGVYAWDYGLRELMDNRQALPYRDAGAVHAAINLYASDQLLQRMAFALSQIWVC